MTNKIFAVFFAIAAAASGACSRGTRGSPPLPGAFTLFSDSFSANSSIPSGFTCEGKNTPPALRWINLPAGTKSLALVVRDPDAPSGEFLHWAVVDIPAGVTGLEPGARLPVPARELLNDAGLRGYTGPCPPSGRHRYVFSLYALGAAGYTGGQARLEDYLDSRSLGKAVLTGLYQRKK